MHTDEIVAGGNQVGPSLRHLGEDDAETSTGAIAHDRLSDVAADREGETWTRGRIGMERDPQGARSGANTVVSESVERPPATDCRDQADSFCLPLRRRALMIERPERSDIRWRKP